jgi:glycoside/pentoside/hexuronide:cation symporter, GPH family
MVADRKEFSMAEGMAILLASVAIQLSSEVMNQWALFFYSPSEGVGRTIYVAMGFAGFIFIIGTLWDAFTDPLIGFLSDKTRTRPGWLRIIPLRGRRRPFIFWGSIGMTFTAIAFWFPPVQEESIINFYYGTVMLCLHWTMFTITVVPLISLGPEIARSERARVMMGTYTAVGMILGLVLANVLPGVLIEALDPARLEGACSAAGYRRVATLFAFVSLALFQLPVWLIRERYDSDAPDHQPAPAKEQILAVLTNRPFIVYAIGFFLFSSGFMAAQRVLPFWAELGLEGSESTVTYLLLPFVAVALLSLIFIPWFEKWLGLRGMMLCAFILLATGMPWMYIIGVADMDTTTKTILGGVLFAWCGIGQGIIYVMMPPMMGEIIDYDELRSGVRRESLYNGLSGFSWKAAMGVAVFVSAQSMHFWGNSMENPAGVFLVGPIAGFFGLLGFAVMLFYPTLHVTREAHPLREEEILDYAGEETENGS